MLGFFWSIKSKWSGLCLCRNSLVKLLKSQKRWKLKKKEEKKKLKALSAWINESSVVGTAVKLACEMVILEATIKSDSGTFIRDALDYSFVSVPRKIVDHLARGYSRLEISV